MEAPASEARRRGGAERGKVEAVGVWGKRAWKASHALGGEGLGWLLVLERPQRGRERWVLRSPNAPP